MKTAIPSLFVLVTACLVVGPISAQDHEPEEIVGSWKVVLDRQLEYMAERNPKLGEAPEEKIAMVQQLLSGIRVVFSAETVELTMAPGGLPNAKKDPAAFEVTGREGNRWTIATTERGRDPKEGTIEWIDGDTIRFQQYTGNDDSVFYLEREKEQGD